MTLRCLFLLLTAGIVHCVSMGAPCNAQWKSHSQPFQKPFRFLGQGWGTGYHWKTPGHDSSYYNPYSAHNSNLISQGGHWGAGNGYVPAFGKVNEASVQTGGYIEAPNFPSVEGELQAIKENNAENFRRQDPQEPPVSGSEEDNKGNGSTSRPKAEQAKPGKQADGLPKEWPFRPERD